MTAETVTRFDQLGLAPPVLDAIRKVGYETPSPIQARTIPLLLDGRDILGQAQTGTGKTAAFALPILSRLDMAQKDPQVLVLAPTRELAIQVAEAFQKYASNLKGFHVLPVYGGQDYGGQIKALKRGVHVVVGTPGRVMDHMRRGTLKLDKLKVLVLDEADEMLRMGFIEDVEWVLEQIPKKRQIALFSATMPKEVKHIASRHLTNPEEVTITERTSSADTIRQRCWPVGGIHKLDALTRILEAEDFDAMIVFVRTRIATVELADKLAARGFAASALNGDIPQQQRERTVDQLKKGKLDILVATDVAARGLDVERVSHVINYDIPYDTEAYIHRIGRTGRAGRKGDAILFVAPRERRLLHAIEKATGQRIENMDLPSANQINDRRITQFKQAITDALEIGKLDFFSNLIEQYQQEHGVSALDIAAALAQLVQGDSPFLLQDKPLPRASKTQNDRKPHRNDDNSASRSRERPAKRAPRSDRSGQEEGMERYRIEVGHDNKVMPGNIVGAIANEAGLDASEIGRINIFDDYSTVDLPAGMPDDIFRTLQKTWVAGKNLKISRLADNSGAGKESRPASKPDTRKPPGKSKKPVGIAGKDTKSKPVAKKKKRAAADKNKGKRKVKPAN